MYRTNLKNSCLKSCFYKLRTIYSIFIPVTHRVKGYNRFVFSPNIFRYLIADSDGIFFTRQKNKKRLRQSGTSYVNILSSSQRK